MSAFSFLTGRGKVPKKDLRKIQKIEEALRVDFHNPQLPGSGYRYWFSGPNRGFPFDRALTEEVRQALQQAGVSLP